MTDGYFSEHVADASDGDLYFYQVDDDPKNYPDPASQFPAARRARAIAGDRSSPIRLERPRLAGSEAAGPGHLRAAHRHVHARRHLGAATRSLPHLRDLGVTLVE